MTTLHLLAACRHLHHTRAGHEIRAAFWGSFAAGLTEAAS